MTEHELKLVFDTRNRAYTTFAYNLLGDWGGANDVMQEVYLLLWEKNIEYTKPKWVDNYCMNAIRYRCKDILKHQRRADRHHQNIYDTSVDFDAFAEARLMKTDLTLKIYQEVENLSVGQRTVFKMKFIQDMETEEIAKELGITVDTVRVQLHKAALKLKEIFRGKTWAV